MRLRLRRQGNPYREDDQAEVEVGKEGEEGEEEAEEEQKGRKWSSIQGSSLDFVFVFFLLFIFLLLF